MLFELLKYVYTIKSHMWVVTEPQKWGRVITGDFKASTKIIWIFEQSPFVKHILSKLKALKI